MESDVPMTNVSDGMSGLEKFNAEYSKLHGYVAAVVCVWGVIANTANIVVLTRKHMISSTNLILMWLAVADLLTMLSYFPYSIHFYIMKDPELQFPATKSFYWIYFMLFHINFTVVCHTIAIWLTIILAIFRYLYICYPAKGQRLCSLRRAKLSILAVYISTTIICVPNYLVNSIASYTKEVPISTEQNNSAMVNKTYYNFALTDDSKQVLNTFNYWIHACLIKVIPCLLLTVLTILLVLAMHDANKRRMKLKSQGRKDESDRAREHNRTTGMLLAVVALFLLTELPQGILTLCSIFIPDFFELVYWQLGDLIDIAALLNNSINFVLYCSMSRQFRNTFVEVFCGCCPKKRPGWLRLQNFKITTRSRAEAQV